MHPDPAQQAVHVGLGSNLGDREAQLARAAAAMAALPQVEVERTSHVFDSAPQGPEQPRYLNAVIELRTTLPPRALLRQLKALEKQLGRVASERWGPRCIDLDILLWGECIVAEPDLQVPHLSLHQRAFALAPLCELAPDARHPVMHQRIQELLANLPDQDVRRLSPFPGGW
jgi:2-amino-4-hydroxy-6-hydroxymethyldihydropteridine diphosphokinase